MSNMGVAAWVRAVVVLAASASLVAACSGGGGSSDGTSPPPPPTVPPPPPPPPPPPVGPAWTPGVYEAASLFKDQCEVVRTGVDIEGNAFPDEPGSLIEEKLWLRSWTRETYLWNTEVADRDPSNASEDRVSYFAALRTTASAPSGSGQPKDQFHFSQPTEDYLAARNAEPSASYGAVILPVTPDDVFAPRDFRVFFTEPGSPASEQDPGGQPKLERGSQILFVDGVDLVNANSQAQINTLNAGLFPASAGEAHTFIVRDPDGAQRSVTLVSADIAPKAVNRTAVISTPSGDVGYMLLNTFSTFASEREVAEATSAFGGQGIDDLVIDLRYNGGGLLAVASQLAYQIAGDARTSGRDFERLRFNADAGATDPVSGGANDPIPFIDVVLGFAQDPSWLAPGTPLESLDLPRVFVLTGVSNDVRGGTCSASESVINGLRGIGFEVVLIGDTTCGKPYGFYPTDNCGETYFTIQFQGVNDQGFGDYADGFAAANAASAPFAVKAPGCAVADDLDHELGDPDEALLAAALAYRQGGAASCPTPSAIGSSGYLSAANLDRPGAIEHTSLSPLGSFLRSNRDMRMPE